MSNFKLKWQRSFPAALQGQPHKPIILIFYLPALLAQLYILLSLLSLLYPTVHLCRTRHIIPNISLTQYTLNYVSIE